MDNAIPPTADPLSAKQAEKLDLEIAILRKKNKWDVVAYFMPILATLVGVAGFFFTVVAFDSQRKAEQGRIVSEQKRDRIAREIDQQVRFQNQIRTDIDEILRSARDEKQPISRVSFLLEDMKTVLDSNVNETKKVSEVFPGYQRTLTKSLVILVRDDCDFTRDSRMLALPIW